MRWTYSIKNKIAASLVLLALCLLVLLSNYLDRLHTENVKSSISTLYEDRLIAEGYILKMTRNIYQIREILNADTNAETGRINEILAEFKSTYNTYMKTRLTKTEQVTAAALDGHFKSLERALAANNHPQTHTEAALDSLGNLSNIQLEESKSIMRKVESQYATIRASSQFAFAIVLVILIVLQILVFSGESLIPLFKPKDPTLN